MFEELLFGKREMGYAYAYYFEAGIGSAGSLNVC